MNTSTSMRFTPRVDLFLAGSLVSMLGSSLTNIALAYQFLLSDSSPTSYAAILYASTVASVVFAARVGAFVDSLATFGPMLLGVNLLNAVCGVGLALSTSALVSSLIVAVATVASIANAAAVSKLIRIAYAGVRLDRVNIRLNEIGTLGTVFGPLLAPAMVTFGVSLTAFYLIDAASFLAAGLLYRAHFAATRAHAAIQGSVPAGVASGLRLFFHGWRLVGSRELQAYFVVFVPFVLGWAGLIYTLAILAKTVAAGDVWRYSAPIIAMFAGRLLAMRLLRKVELDQVNYGTLFGISLLAAAGTLWPMGYVTDLALFCAFEFVLGIAVAINLLCARILLQRLSPVQDLGTAQGLSLTIEKIAKLVSVPVLVAAISHGGGAWGSGLLAGAYFLACLCAFAFLPATYRRRREDGEMADSSGAAQRTGAGAGSR